MRSIPIYFGFLVITAALLVVAIAVHRLNGRVNNAGDKIAVLECSHVWNDQKQTIVHSSYAEYHRCLSTIER